MLQKERIGHLKINKINCHNYVYRQHSTNLQINSFFLDFWVKHRLEITVLVWWDSRPVWHVKKPHAMTVWVVLWPVCVIMHVLSVGNSGQFNMDRLSGLISRGDKALDRETQSSHVLEVEAFNSDQGSMRSSVRVGVCWCLCVCKLCIRRLVHMNKLLTFEHPIKS